MAATKSVASGPCVPDSVRKSHPPHVCRRYFFYRQNEPTAMPQITNLSCGPSLEHATSAPLLTKDIRHMQRIACCCVNCFFLGDVWKIFQVPTQFALFVIVVREWGSITKGRC